MPPRIIVQLTDAPCEGAACVRAHVAGAALAVRQTVRVNRCLPWVIVAVSLTISTADTAAAATATPPFAARVTSVTDADTIRVRDGTDHEFTVRLEGIDCPESGQPFGGVARRFTRTAVFDQAVIIKPVGRDRYGRLVARVTRDGHDLSFDLVTNGLAWQFTDSSDRTLAIAEREARVAKRGLWSVPDPVPPWVWRRNARSNSNRGSPDDVSGPFHGNTSTRVFHAASCKNAKCRNCTAIFLTTKAAIAAGYRPARDCLH
jgi:micrococcal nuclease